MKLSDILKPGKDDKKLSLTKLVRSKQFKTMVAALSSKNNPKDENHNANDIMGDGQRSSTTINDNQQDLL